MSQINETAIKTPGVYTTEIPVFPPSVAQVATAVPAFIGYTEKAIKNGKDVTMKAVRLSSLVQFVQYFGDSFDNLSATVTINNDNSIGSVEINPKYQLFNAMQMFFNHGGSNCYVISVGRYSSADSKLADFVPGGTALSCFDVLAKEDEPTLIVIPDAVLLDDAGFNSLMTSALKQCGDLQDRFTIMDIREGFKDITIDDVVSTFRNGVASSFINYGAAYYPWLRTSLPYKITYANTKTKKGGVDVAMATLMPGNALVTRLDNIVKDKVKVDNFIQPFSSTMDNITSKADLEGRLTSIKDMIAGVIGLTGFTDVPPPPKTNVEDRFKDYIKKGTGNSFTPLEVLMREALLIDKSFPGGALAKVAEADFNGYQVTGIAADATVYGTPAPANDNEAAIRVTPRVRSLYTDTYAALTGLSSEIQNIADSVEQSLESSTAVYANIKSAIKREGIVVPPSGAIAGAYASVDGTRGVWKAPANVPLNTVIEPMVAIDNNMQDNLNVDPNGGKSINAIRTFTGKGTLIWGARTLAGNDNEWRYVSVRRFFIMVEESAKKATEPFVFEPNDANTWAKVRGMLENFLLILWRQGALAGAKPEHAFFVKCGLGQTMTAQDILEGRLIVEVGLAAVRPAEFIILRFSHKVQES
jgi:phage tail sheath protein FI